jgi:ribosomal protein S12 methylthiotransferase accessory factor
MESIEGFHAERVPPAALTATTAELERAGRRFLPPTALVTIPQVLPHSASDAIDWLEAKRLGDGAPVLVPRRFLSMDQTVVWTEVATWNMFVSTNGLASGNTREEAIVHGLYELIERDSMYEYRYERTPAEQVQRRVDLATLPRIPHIVELLGRLDEADIELTVSAIHGHLGVPAFAAMVRPRALVDHAISSGCGAHYVPEVALSRAITEAVQSRITFISGSRDDLMPWHYWDAGPAPAAVNDPSSSGLSFADVPRPPRFATFPDVLRWTVDVLAVHGLVDSCYFDHQRPELGDIPVVSVVCPGLRIDFQVAHQARNDR